MSEYRVIDPATGDLIREYPEATAEQIEAALAATADAAQSWSRATSVAERAAAIERVADLYEERRDELAAIIIREMGKPIDQAHGEIDFSIDIYRYFGRIAAEALADEDLPVAEGEGAAIVRKQPIGSVLGVMPWNFPYYQVARFAGANLVLGNPVILKHAPQCPESAAVMEEIFHAAGFPAGAYVNVYATHEQIQQIIADPRTHGASLTGSGRAGAAIAEVAGRHLKKVVLELGGSDPFVVLSTDDLDAVVAAGIAGRLDNSGQACNAAKRFVIAEDLYEDFLERFRRAFLAVEVEAPQVSGSTLGPLSSLPAAERLEDQLRRSEAGGAVVERAGERSGAWFPPAIVTGLTSDNPAYHEEFFGPVAVVFRAADEADAIRIANDTPYGLSAYVHASDRDQALRVADAIETGMVSINGAVIEASELPFGGVKNSGFGRELGPTSFDEFANRKLIRLPD